VTIASATIRSRTIGGYNRLDANFYTSPGVAASERVGLLEASGMQVLALGVLAGRVWDPARFARTYATPQESSEPYLRPYDAFDYVPAAADRLSLTRNSSLEDLRLRPGMILQTCSGRNLGPSAVVDEVLAGYTLSHDMIRIEIDDPQVRFYVATFLQTPTGQALLRRNMSGSVIDHLTVPDVKGVPVPFVSVGLRNRISQLMEEATYKAQRARRDLLQLAELMQNSMPMPSAEGLGRHGWTLTSHAVGSRLDAAYHDPLVAIVREQMRCAGGHAVSEWARAIKPPRYRRFYVAEGHGRPVLSGRQLLQARPINLRYVSDRSFKNSSDYELTTGMIIFGGVGRAEGRGTCQPFRGS